MEATLTLANPAQTDLLIGLMQEFYVHEHLPFDERVARRALDQILRNSAFGMVYLINLADAVIGYVVLTFGFSLEFHGRDAIVDELYVRENYRGRGIGKASLLFIEGICLEQGIKALHLEVDHANTGAQAVYRKAGFRDHDRYLLTKWLEQ